MTTTRIVEAEPICALATPPGHSAIAVIRVSGKAVSEKIKFLCPFFPDTADSHRLYFGHIQSASGEQIDEVLIAYFAQNKSYTGEESIEISCHGNPLIASRIIEELKTVGIRMARPGEFTFRAFLNGKKDLIQAESVHALIASRSEKALKVAFEQLKGSLSKFLAEIEQELLFVLANIEANIDFLVENTIAESWVGLRKRLEKAHSGVNNLIASYSEGRLLRQGFKIAIVGAVNVGKSSLLNKLLGFDRAIVTEIEGTTRDVIEGEKIVDGILVKYFDTAGLRETFDKVEKIGMQKTLEALGDADLLLHVVDSVGGNFKLPETKDIPIIVAHNKADLLDQTAVRNNKFVYTSALTGEGISQLEREIRKHIHQNVSESGPIITQARQKETLSEVSAAVARAIELVDKQASLEFIAFEIQDALSRIGELNGKKYDGEIMKRIFEQFCIGK